MEPFEKTVLTQEADDGAIYGVAFISVVGLVMTVVLFSDLVLLGKSLLLLKYNLHLTRVNPFQVTHTPTQPPAPTPRPDVPYYIRDFANIAPTANTPSNFTRIPDWNARRPKRVFMSQ